MRKTLCKLQGCERKRFQLRTLCLFHIRERERARKAEREAKKKTRRLNSKGYQESQKKLLIKKCDAAFSKIIRSTGHCLWPETEDKKHKGRSECSHIFSRRYMAIRWHELNAKPLCTAHHFNWHKHPAEAAVFLATIRTPDEIAWLQKQANSVKQWQIHELKQLLADLSAKLSTLQ